MHIALFLRRSFVSENDFRFEMLTAPIHSRAFADGATASEADSILEIRVRARAKMAWGRRLEIVEK